MPNDRRHLSPDLLDWVMTDTPVAIQTTEAAHQQMLARMSESDRQAVIDWLDGNATQAFSPDLAPVSAATMDDQARATTVAWLLSARSVMASDQLSVADKFRKLLDNPPADSTLSTLKAVGGAAFAGYRSLPLALQLSLPATLVAAPFLGGAGVGIAALGGAIRLPALLVFFLGVSGITSVIEALLHTKDGDAVFLQSVLALLATDAALFRLNQATRETIAKDIAQPRKQPMPTPQDALLAKLLSLSPFDFERHVMAFFADAGMTAWVTPAGADAGIDGVAKDGQRAILVQCKRYAPGNPVGRPVIQQFKGVIEENAAALGVFVTTSDFTAQARESAAKNERLVLVDGERLMRWHSDGFDLDPRD